MSRHARRVLLAAAVSSFACLSFSVAGSAAVQQAGCSVEAHPPTLYAGMVFGAGRVVCSTPANRITITVALEKDGVEVARGTRRDCRKVSVCWNTVGAIANDEPGDQTWCSRVWASAGGTFLGELRTCETAEF